MGRVVGQKHFYCTPAFLPDKSYLIYECRNKSKGIDGGFVYKTVSRHYAYKIAKVLNELYRLGRLGALARWKFVCSYSPCTRSQNIMDLHFARRFLSPDDSEFLSASIIGGQNG